MSKSRFNLKSIYKKTIMIAVPVMVQNLITNFVAMLDNIMVGQVGTEQMSGVAIVNQLLFVFNITIFGAVSGSGIFTAQFFGKKDYDGVRHTMRFKLMTVSLLTLLGATILLLFGDELISIYLHDAGGGIDLEKTFGYAKDYLAIMLFGLVPFALENAYSSTLREGGNAVMPMISGIVAVVTNTVLNYFLIFGIAGFPKLGVEGAAIATVIARWAQAGIVVVWTHLRRAEFSFVKGLYHSFAVPRQLVVRMVKTGVIPLMVNECLWSGSIAALTQCYSVRGIDVVAGLNISNTVVNLFNVMFIAFGAGVSVVIGQLLGANELENAKKSAPGLIGFCTVMCAVIGGVMVAFSTIFPNIYNTSADVRTLASTFIMISAITMPIHGALHTIYFILRSGGKTGITFLFDSGFSWGVSVPTALCLVHFTNMPIVGIYICIQSIEALKCIVGYILIKKDVWLSNIVS